VTVTNPLDLTPAAGDEVFAAAVGAMLDDPGVDVGIVGCVPFTPALQTLARDPGHGEDAAASDAIATRLATLGHRKPWVAVVDAGAAYDPLRSVLTAAGVPVFPTADRAVRSLSRYVERRLQG
jgi:acyl-CoA synthetase (NDP forming)